MIKKYITYILCLPSDLLGYLLTLFIWLFWGTNLHWDEGLWCELKETSWFYRKFYKGWSGTTLGRGGFYAPGRKTCCKDHEKFHVRQYTSSTLGVVLAVVPLLFVSWWCIISLFFGYPIWIISGIIETWSKGLPIYRGDEDEIAAYALDELKEKS